MEGEQLEGNGECHCLLQNSSFTLAHLLSNLSGHDALLTRDQRLGANIPDLVDHIKVNLCLRLPLSYKALKDLGMEGLQVFALDVSNNKQVRAAAAAPVNRLHLLKNADVDMMRSASNCCLNQADIDIMRSVSNVSSQETEFSPACLCVLPLQFFRPLPVDDFVSDFAFAIKRLERDLE
eukprot:1157340-Pelagomonas_calceolata.AAC.16